MYKMSQVSFNIYTHEAVTVYMQYGTLSILTAVRVVALSVYTGVGEGVATWAEHFSVTTAWSS
jgi:hypothetical protein